MKNLRRRKPPLEKDIQSAILQLLRASGFFVWKQNTAGIRKPNGSYIPSQLVGVADILGVGPKGRFLAVEVKRPGGVLSPAQKLFLDNITLQGGIACVVFSVDDMHKIIKEWRYGTEKKTVAPARVGI